MSLQALWQSNALFAGDAIVQRLRTQVPALRQVLQIDEFEPGVTLPKQLPAAVVLLDTMRVTNPNAARGLGTAEQDWVVAIGGRTARAAAGSQADEFGALIPAVVSALQGWQPQGSTRAFAWRSAPRPVYGRDVSYFPLLFTIQVVTS